MRKRPSKNHQETIERLFSELDKAIHDRGLRTKWIAAKSNITTDAFYKVRRRDKTPGAGFLIDVGDALGFELVWREK